MHKSGGVAVALTALFLAPPLFWPMAARASEEGRRNTTLGLGTAAAALLLTQKNKLPGLLVAGGAVYAYGQYEHAINKRHARERREAYRVGYRRGYKIARYHRSIRYHRSRPR